jgi:hypothetical protein
MMASAMGAEIDEIQDGAGASAIPAFADAIRPARASFDSRQTSPDFSVSNDFHPEIRARRGS